MKLNIGSSGKLRKPYSDPDWVSIDIDPSFVKKKNAKFVIADGTKLPFRENCFQEIRLIHVLEHIPRKEHENIYKEIFRTLQPDGSVFIEVPDFVKICNYIVEEYMKLDEKDVERIRCWTLSIYGKGRGVGDFHRWGFYPALLRKDLENQGFKVEFPLDLHISDHYLMEPVILVKAIK